VVEVEAESLDDGGGGGRDSGSAGAEVEPDGIADDLGREPYPA
jgi:hypothetical protein